MRRLIFTPSLVAIWAGAVLVASPAQSTRYFPISDVKPGQVGVGRTVFAGTEIEEFKADILGVLSNVTGPKQNLILARLSGGPLEKTGVIQGMSGSPVYIDGRLVGAVSYSLGTFPKEALAGITPIGEMTQALDEPVAPAGSADLGIEWPATPDQVFAALARVAARAAAPLGGWTNDSSILGPSSLGDLAPTLRPIGAAMAVNGFDPSLARDIRNAFGADGSAELPQAPNGTPADIPLRPGDPVGVSMVRGDYQIGATGTVTHVDGSRVYAFGHPFLNLGSAKLAMTRAQVFTVIPSLDTSIKLAVLGPAIGTMTQDRSTGIGGTLGAPPRELAFTLTLQSPRGPDRKLEYRVLHDQALMPLFTYVALVNSLTAFERQMGTLTITASGNVSFGGGGQVAIDDIFSGDTVLAAAASATTSALGIAAMNEFTPALAESMDLTLRISEDVQTTTIERAWLDTTRPRAGETHTLNVLLRHYRGGTQTLSMPVTMPSKPGDVTLLVSDGATLAALEDRELMPGRPTSWNELLLRLNSARRNNRVYVRLITEGPGTVVGGSTLPALPASVRSVLSEDKSVSTSAVARSVVGAWEERLARAVRGSREIKLTIAPANAR